MAKPSAEIFNRMVFDQELSRYIIKEHPNSYALSQYSLSGPVYQVINAIQVASEGLINPVMDVDISHGYYDSVDVDVTLTGSRLATDEEVEAYIPWKAKKDEQAVADAKKAKEKADKERAISKQREDARALARAKKAFPDMFKDK